MNRFSLVVLLFVSVAISAFAENDHFAVTPTEKEALLTKAEVALTWFRTLDREILSHTAAAEFRKRMLPLEVMQAAALLKQADQGDVSRMVREMFPFFQPTNEECFDIRERLGDEMLDAFAEEKETPKGDHGADSVTLIRKGAAMFLKEALSHVERMVLYREPTTPQETMKVVYQLTGPGRPGLVRYYLRKFLEYEITPEEAAEIVDNIGAATLFHLSRKAEFLPQGGEAASKIFAGAREYWRDPETLREPLERLGSSERAEVVQSVRALWKGADVSIEMLLERLAQSDDEKEITAIQDFLPSFGAEVAEAMSETFRSGNPILVARTAKTLKKISPERLGVPLLCADV